MTHKRKPDAKTKEALIADVELPGEKETYELLHKLQANKKE